MAFVPKEWKDRLVEFAGRRKLTNVSTGEEMIVDVVRNEGTVSQEGDAFSAANMSDLEQRVADEFNNINTNLHWKLLGSVNGTSTISIPSEFEELHIVLSNSSVSFEYDFRLIKDQISDTQKQLCDGFLAYSNASKYDYVRIDYSTGGIKCYTFYSAGTDYASNSILTVYYR